MEKTKIDRINELARISRERALTDEEKKEQAAFREEYIKNFRTQFSGVLENTYIQRPDGSREKIKKSK